MKLLLPGSPEYKRLLQDTSLAVFRFLATGDVIEDTDGLVESIKRAQAQIPLRDMGNFTAHLLGIVAGCVVELRRAEPSIGEYMVWMANEFEVDLKLSWISGDPTEWATNALTDRNNNTEGKKEPL